MTVTAVNYNKSVAILMEHVKHFSG